MIKFSASCKIKLASLLVTAQCATVPSLATAAHVEEATGSSTTIQATCKEEQRLGEFLRNQGLPDQVIAEIQAQETGGIDPDSPAGWALSPEHMFNIWAVTPEAIDGAWNRRKRNLTVAGGAAVIVVVGAAASIYVWGPGAAGGTAVAGGSTGSGGIWSWLLSASLTIPGASRVIGGATWVFQKAPFLAAAARGIGHVATPVVQGAGHVIRLGKSQAGRLWVGLMTAVSVEGSVRELEVHRRQIHRENLTLVDIEDRFQEMLNQWFERLQIDQQYGDVTRVKLSNETVIRWIETRDGTRFLVKRALELPNEPLVFVRQERRADGKVREYIVSGLDGSEMLYQDYVAAWQLSLDILQGKHLASNQQTQLAQFYLQAFEKSPDRPCSVDALQWRERYTKALEESLTGEASNKSLVPFVQSLIREAMASVVVPLPD